MIGDLLAMLVASASADASEAPTCRLAAGWQRAADQRPSTVPYSEPIANVAVQLDKASWSWNGRIVSEARLMRYLRNVRFLNPAPLNFFAFSAKLTCSEKRALQARMAAVAACPIDGKPCLEGTLSEYLTARGLP
jgi:hypothetical protein